MSKGEAAVSDRVVAINRDGEEIFDGKRMTPDSDTHACSYVYFPCGRSGSIPKFEVGELPFGYLPGEGPSDAVISDGLSGRRLQGLRDGELLSGAIDIGGSR